MLIFLPLIQLFVLYIHFVDSLSTYIRPNASLSKNFFDAKNFVGVKSVNATYNKLKKRSGPASFKLLTPGQEFLLSVASYEDAKGSTWESLPYLLKILQSDKINEKINGVLQKRDKYPVSEIPMEMMQMMKVMTAMEKSDDEDSGNSDGSVSSFSKFLQRLAQDPMNILLAAIIPFSLLLAAVIPLLFNQLSNGSVLPTITTTAASGKAYEQRQVLENLVPVLEGIASFGSKLSQEMTKQNTDKNKINVLKNILSYISSYVGEKWMKKFALTTVQRMRSSCTGANCASKM